MTSDEWLRKSTTKDLLAMRELFKEFSSQHSLIQIRARQVEAVLLERAYDQVKYMTALDEGS